MSSNLLFSVGLQSVNVCALASPERRTTADADIVEERILKYVMCVCVCVICEEIS